MSTTAQEWDERYGSGRVFSANPNGVLVTEAAGLPPGRALDVGCGEGADARWLARRGWKVTAVDVSQVALDRAMLDAEADGPEVGARVRWTQADLTGTAPTAGAFDLVSLQYFPLPRSSGGMPSSALRGLLDAVAPEGTLLVVGHDLAGAEGHVHGFDPAAYDHPADVARFLDDAWEVQVDETRPRTAPGPPGTHHTHDAVLRARRSPIPR